ncbi:PQQ-dependent sugar dehydrogenase [Iamia sp.]|uniref:PQQ-dependent sugar dehydrogenase n=1 Tax=Iamia sp. TaxID=2722710 RepID=UPI002B754573|nr:PQQ-dependent sugar dehydrogenase [Iamia sp.]HXH56816.1 PQQ-dependent sugar dehydrogenase [Iamia sp.]
MRALLRRPHPMRAVVVVATVIALLGACGEDEPAGTGEAVEGRVPTTAEPTEDDTPDTTSSAPTAETTEGDGPPDTTAEEPPTSSAEPADPGDAPAPGALGDVAITLTEVATLEAPTKLVARPGSDLLYVAEQGGRITALTPTDDGGADTATALDLTDVTRSGGEQGLLGLAFAPDGATLYVHHSGTAGETRIASFAMDGDDVDAASRTELLEVDQPFANHNGGDIVVDDDGLLWIGLGDGGSSGDPDDRAQDPEDLLGKILRIDPTRPTGELPYAIPEDNPFADGVGGRPEVAVIGVRNPWRLRFDAETGDLWVADVGQDAVEEIDRLPADAILGANLGWSRFEGSAVYDESREVRGTPPVGPVFEMDHDDGWCSVTGGPVYRGDALDDLQGAYLFGDFCKPGLAALRLDGDQVTETAVLDEDVGQVVSIDTDADGEVYVLSLGGQVLRLDLAS